MNILFIMFKNLPNDLQEFVIGNMSCIESKNVFCIPYDQFISLDSKDMDKLYKYELDIISYV